MSEGGTPPPPRGRGAARLRAGAGEGEERRPERDLRRRRQLFLHRLLALPEGLRGGDLGADAPRGLRPPDPRGAGESAASGVVYSETFLSPDFCGGRDVAPGATTSHAIREAAEEAEREDGITCAASSPASATSDPRRRRKPPSARPRRRATGSWASASRATRRRESPSDFAWSFDLAREAGLRLTAHAGEWGGPESVRDALRDLRPERIGHGVRAIEDLALVDRLAEDGIVLEVCPGSNVALGIYPRWRTTRSSGSAPAA
jgi:hypothetical protein